MNYLQDILAELLRTKISWYFFWGDFSKVEVSLGFLWGSSGVPGPGLWRLFWECLGECFVANICDKSFYFWYTFINLTVANLHCNQNSNWWLLDKILQNRDSKKLQLTWTCQLSLAKSHLSPFSSVLVLSSRKNNLFFSYRKWCHDRRNKFDDLLDLFHPLKPREDFPFSFSIMHITHLIAQGHTVTGCLIS